MTSFTKQNIAFWLFYSGVLSISTILAYHATFAQEQAAEKQVAERYLANATAIEGTCTAVQDGDTITIDGLTACRLSVIDCPPTRISITEK